MLRSVHWPRKTAARKGLKLIRNMMRSGSLDDMARADSLAKTPGVLKPSVAGSEIRDLGAGGEGLATMVADPKRGVSVRKLYDPEGIATPELIRRKDVVGRSAVSQSEHLPAYYGQASTPRGDGAMQFSEYIPAKPGTEGVPLGKDFSRAKRDVMTASRRAGFDAPQDIRRGNAIVDARDNRTKIVDFIPGKSDEFVSGKQKRIMGYSPENLAVTDDGSRLFNTTGSGGTRAADLKQQFLGSGRKAQMPSSRDFATGTPTSFTKATQVGKQKMDLPTAVGKKQFGGSSNFQPTAVGKKPKIPSL